MRGVAMVLAVTLALASPGRGAPARTSMPELQRLRVAASAEPAARRAMRLDVLGVRLGMSEAEAWRRLERLGTRQEIESEESEGDGGEAVERELWTLRGSDYAFVVLGVEAGKVVALQAHARPGRRTIRYRDVGDLGAARRLGTYIYQWQVPGWEGSQGARVEARGADPDYLGSYSIVRDRPLAIR